MKRSLRINVAEAGDHWIVRFPTGNVVARDRTTVVDLVRDWVNERGNLIATIFWEADDQQSKAM
jgi:hypothetical protein